MRPPILQSREGDAVDATDSFSALLEQVRGAINDGEKDLKIKQRAVSVKRQEIEGGQLFGVRTDSLVLISGNISSSAPREGMTLKGFRSYVRFGAAVSAAFLFRNALLIAALSIIVLVAWLRFFETPVSY